MGITIIQKSDLSTPRRHPKIALVLAGGGVSGGAFKLGGLLALNRFMVNQKSTGFDLYVGTSAGAIIAAYLANGVSVLEILRGLEGRRPGWDLFTPADRPLTAPAPVRASDLYFPNYRDFILAPFRMGAAMVSRGPVAALRLAARNNLLRASFRRRLGRLLRHPSAPALVRFAQDCLDDEAIAVRRPAIPWGFIPAGLFSTGRFERAMRRSFETAGLSNDFTELHGRTGKALYLTATNLNTAQRTVFSHEAHAHVPVSQAVAASIAVPLFYKPVTIDGIDYVDGAVAKTTSIDLAVAKGADLIICYNPFRPFNHDSYCRVNAGGERRPGIAHDGIYAVLNQVMRTLIHTRLMNGLELRRTNPEFRGDILLIEPSEYDDRFFDMNPLSFGERRRAARRGYESVRAAIGEHYPELKRILNAYGIDTSPRFLEDPPPAPIPYIKTLYENIQV